MWFTNNIPWLLGGGHFMEFGRQSISREPRACARMSLPLSLLLPRLCKHQSALKPNLNHHGARLVEGCQRNQFRSSTAVINFDRVSMAAIDRGDCCNSATTGLWGPGFNPGKAKSNRGSSTRLSGERWWTQREEQEFLRCEAGKNLAKRSFHMFTRSRSGHNVHSWGYS